MLQCAQGGFVHGIDSVSLMIETCLSNFATFAYPIHSLHTPCHEQQLIEISNYSFSAVFTVAEWYGKHVSVSCYSFSSKICPALNGVIHVCTARLTEDEIGIACLDTTNCQIKCQTESSTRCWMRTKTMISMLSISLCWSKAVWFSHIYTYM